MRTDSQQAFLEGYDEHSQSLFRYCLYKTSDREVALDLVQDVFTRTWAFINGGGEIENMRAFLYRTVNNLIIDHYRKRQSVSLETLSEKGFDPGFTDADRQIDKLDGEIAMKLLNKLPDIYRDVIFMRFVQDLQVKEIAEILGESENTISVRLHRGLDKVKKLYEHEA